MTVNLKKLKIRNGEEEILCDIRSDTYVKPTSGIPEEDLSQAVKNGLVPFVNANMSYDEVGIAYNNYGKHLLYEDDVNFGHGYQYIFLPLTNYSVDIVEELEVYTYCFSGICRDVKDVNLKEYIVTRKLDANGWGALDISPVNEGAIEPQRFYVETGKYLAIDCGPGGGKILDVTVSVDDNTQSNFKVLIGDNAASVYCQNTPEVDFYYGNKAGWNSTHLLLAGSGMDVDIISLGIDQTSIELINVSEIGNVSAFDGLHIAYEKPSTGIPESDLAQAVKNSLVFEKGKGTNSIKQAGTNVLAYGDKSFAIGDIGTASAEVTQKGSDISFTLDSVADCRAGGVVKFGTAYRKIIEVGYNFIVVESPGFPSLSVGDSLTIILGMAYGIASHVEGGQGVASGEHSHAEGSYTAAGGDSAHSEGLKTSAIGWASHAEGESTSASVSHAHAEGNNTKASGQASHAEGQGTTADGGASHAEGYSTKAQGLYSHAEGESTTASGMDSHAEGQHSNASGTFAHVEGFGGNAGQNTVCAHVEGYLGAVTNQQAQAVHVEGYMTQANNLGEHAEGRCNKSNTVVPVDPSAPTPQEMGKATLHSVGMGYPIDPSDPSTAVRMNAFEIMQNGDVYVNGIGGYDGTNPSSASTLKQVIDGKQDKFLIAEYNVTDYAPINEAYNNGKEVVCRLDSLYDATSQNHYYTSDDVDSQARISVPLVGHDVNADMYVFRLVITAYKDTGSSTLPEVLLRITLLVDTDGNWYKDIKEIMTI